MGRIRWLRKSQWRFQNDKYSQLMSRRPEAGNQPRWTAKSKINSSANQKSGVAKPMKTKTVVALSKREYCRVADRTPMGTAKSRMIAISITLSMRVMGRRSPIFWSTGRPSGANERPKSSRASRMSQFQYWTGKGLSSPYCLRSICLA